MQQHTASNEKEPAISDPRTNERIRVPEVRLVGPAGEQVGVVRVEDALHLAREAELDLVEVAPDARPPVVKIMDYGKFKYEQAQKAKDARRNQANTVLKEVRFRLKIDAHDYETKRKRAQGFLEAGDKVKAMILFRGREQSRPEMGAKLLQRFAEDIREFGAVESSPTIDGRNMTMVIGPLRSKSDAKAEQNAERTVQRKALQEKRRLESERKAARQAELEASRPQRAPLPARSTAGVGETEPARSPRPATSSSRPAGSTRPAGGDSRPPRPASSEPRSSESRSSEPRSDSRSTEPRSSESRQRTTPRTVTPTPAQAPRPSSPPRPAAASGAAPAPSAAPKPAAKPAVPKPAGKPAAPSAARPAAPKAKPAGPPASEPASE